MKVSTGTIVLTIGIFLLIFTFVVAFLFLLNDIQLSLPQDVIQTLGGVFAPMIILASHAVYLGIMVWIGAELAIRGIELSKKETPEPPKTT